MRHTILTILGWFFGLGCILGGISKLFANPLEAVYLLSFGIILFPPANKLIHKLPNPKLIKIIIGVVLFTSFIAQVYLEQRPTPEKKFDAIKKSNTNLIKQLAKSYCIENKKCPMSLDELYSTGHTAPFESYRVEDYTYQPINNGEDCVVSTILSTGEKYAELCIGEKLEYSKYLR